MKKKIQLGLASNIIEYLKKSGQLANHKHIQFVDVTTEDSDIWDQPGSGHPIATLTLNDTSIKYDLDKKQSIVFVYTKPARTFYQTGNFVQFKLNDESKPIFMGTSHDELASSDNMVNGGLYLLKPGPSAPIVNNTPEGKAARIAHWHIYPLSADSPVNVDYLEPFNLRNNGGQFGDDINLFDASGAKQLVVKNVNSTVLVIHNKTYSFGGARMETRISSSKFINGVRTQTNIPSTVSNSLRTFTYKEEYGNVEIGMEMMQRT